MVEEYPNDAEFTRNGVPTLREGSTASHLGVRAQQGYEERVANEGQAPVVQGQVPTGHDGEAFQWSLKLA